MRAAFRRCAIVFAVCAGLLLLYRTSRDTPRDRRAARRPVDPTAPAARPAAPPRRPPAAPAPPAAVSPAEAIVYLTSTYRRELIARELALEQQRYQDAYWQPERSGPERARLRLARAALRQQLSEEATAVLRTTVAGAGEARIELDGFFDDDHPGPNVSFASPASRAAFAAAIAELGTPDPARLAAAAARTLSSTELVDYHHWNDVAAVALRDALLGFDATEAEFREILQQQPHADVGADVALASVLAPERFAALQRLRDPAVRDATHDLDRLGLPVQYAGWLAATRRSTIAALAQIAQDTSLTSALRQTRTADAESSFRQIIATTLGVSASTLDELSPSP